MASRFSRAIRKMIFSILIIIQETTLIKDQEKSNYIKITLLQNFQYRNCAFDFVQESRHVVVASDTSICLLVTFATRTARQKQKLARCREKHCIRARNDARRGENAPYTSVRSFILHD